jgi:RNA polymerase sigma-70 factor, ECF subfamily
LFRQVGTDADDLLHDILIDVAEGIRKRGMRAPERLMGYVHSVARFKIAGYINSAARRRREMGCDAGFEIADTRHDPEQRVIADQQVAILRKYLQRLRPRDREILVRYYVQEQTPEQIQNEMQLTPTQFRLQKSRAKAYFTARVQSLLSRPLKKPAFRSETVL